MEEIRRRFLKFDRFNAPFLDLEQMTLNIFSQGW